MHDADDYLELLRKLSGNNNPWIGDELRTALGEDLGTFAQSLQAFLNEARVKHPRGFQGGVDVVYALLALAPLPDPLLTVQARLGDMFAGDDPYDEGKDAA